MSKPQEETTYEEHEQVAFPWIPNVQYFVDANGEGWYCTTSASENGLGGICYREADLIYDRNFGG